MPTENSRGLRQRIDRHPSGLLAIFSAKRDRDLAGAQRPWQHALHGRRRDILGEDRQLGVVAGARGAVDIVNRLRRSHADAEQIQRLTAIGGVGQAGTANDRADRQARSADIRRRHPHRIHGEIIIGRVDIVDHHRVNARLAMLEIGVPRPVFAQAAVEIEDTAEKLAPVGRNRNAQALRFRGQAVVGQMRAVGGEIVEVAGAQREAGDAKPIHLRRDAGIEIGIVALNGDGAVFVGDKAVIFRKGFSVIELQRCRNRIGQFIAAISEKGECPERNGEMIDIAFRCLRAAAVRIDARYVSEIERRGRAIGADKLNAAKRIGIGARGIGRAGGDQAALGRLGKPDIVGVNVVAADHCPARKRDC